MDEDVLLHNFHLFFHEKTSDQYHLRLIDLICLYLRMFLVFLIFFFFKCSCLIMVLFLLSENKNKNSPTALNTFAECLAYLFALYSLYIGYIKLYI